MFSLVSPMLPTQEYDILSSDNQNHDWVTATLTPYSTVLKLSRTFSLCTYGLEIFLFWFSYIQLKLTNASINYIKCF